MSYIDVRFHFDKIEEDVLSCLAPLAEMEEFTR